MFLPRIFSVQGLHDNISIYPVRGSILMITSAYPIILQFFFSNVQSSKRIFSKGPTPESDGGGHVLRRRMRYHTDKLLS
jgi:hypothetical protein